MEQGGFQLSELWGAVRRRYWLLLLSIVIVTPVGLMTAVGLPSTYSSTAKILVEAQQIPDNLVRSTVQVDAAERMALLQQRLLTRQNLLDMAGRLDLFADAPEMSPTAVLNTLRRAISIKDITLRDRKIRSRGPILATAFTITYSSQSPTEAARVAGELVSMVLEQNLETRAQRATETRRFLQKKAEDLAAELVAVERQIADFKIENANALPESLEVRRSELTGLRGRRFEFEREVLALVERQSLLEESLLLGHSVAGAVDTLTPEEQDLQQLKRQLAQAQGIFADTHPNIRALVSRIDALESTIAESRRVAEAEAESASDEPDDTSQKTAVRRELGSVERRLEALRQEIGNIEDRQKELAESIAQTPEVEIALRALERRHSDLSAQYQDAVRKEAAAADGEELEISRQAERYRVLEPAQIPETPDWPPRKMIALGGAGGSVVLGVLLMVFAELRNMSVRTAGQIERRVNIRPLATIPEIRSRYDHRRRFWRRLLLLLFIVGAGSAAAMAVHRFYLPLDLLAERAMDRSGLTELLSGGDS